MLLNSFSYYTFNFIIVITYIFFLFCSLFLKTKKKILSKFYINLFILFILFSLLFFFVKFYMSITVSLLNFSYNNYNFSTNIFCETIICLCLMSTVVSWIYLGERYILQNNFYILYFLFFFICTVQMVYSTNLFVMFIYFEFLFIPSLFFVYYLGYSKKTDITVLFLLKWTLCGSFIVLLCFCYIYSLYNSLYIEDLYQLNISSLETTTVFLFVFIGFGVKLPVWPFYYWLTKVHVEAPTGFSIFLSGFLVKTAFFCLTNFFFFFNNLYLFYLYLAIAIWGSIDSSIRMWTSTDIKRLIAFATIQEMNLILILFLLLNDFNYTILNCFLLVHGILSTFFFYLIDQIYKQSFTRNLTYLSGLSTYLPILTFFIWISLLVFRGFPIFIKFFIEWELLNLFFINFSLFGFLLFFIISFFGVTGFSRIFFIILYGSPYNLFKYDLLKKDVIIGISFIFFLFFLNILILYF